MFFQNTVISPWIALTLGGLLMLVIAAHIGMTQHSTRAPSRRRIRMANGWVMLITTPLLAAGFGVVNTQMQPRLFAIVWMAVILLLGLTMVLAMMDILNTLRLARAARQRMAGTAFGARLGTGGESEVVGARGGEGEPGATAAKLNGEGGVAGGRDG